MTLEELLKKIDTWAKYKWSPFDDFWRWRYTHGTRTPDLPDIADYLRRKRIGELLKLVHRMLDQLQHPWVSGSGTFDRAWDYLPRRHNIATLFAAVRFARRHQMRLDEQAEREYEGTVGGIYGPKGLDDL